MSHSFKYSTRLNSFRARPDLYDWRTGPQSTLDLIERAAGVTQLDSVELNYPEHFVHHSPMAVRECLSATPLTVSGINLRYDAPRFLDGGFTNPQPARRAEAIQVTLDAIEACRQLGGTHVVIWPAYDGFDYAFEVDYAQIWDWEVAALRAIGAAAGDLRISIEYKPCEPRKFSLLGTIGATLLAIEESGAPLGVTLDFCHMLMANEQPALSAALCIRKHKLFGIHLNDGYGQIDDGLMVGSVHLMQTAELLFYLVQARYDGVIYFDTFPTREDPVQECAANIARVEQVASLVQRVDLATLRRAWDAQDGFQNNLRVWEALLAR